MLAAGLLAASGAAHADGDDSQGAVERCTQALGTLAVAEPQSQTMSDLGHYGLGSPSAMLRMMIQDSGCFTVVERGAAMQNLQQERALASSGQLQGDSNVGAGQLQAADFVLTPAVQFSADSGGVGSTVGNLLGRFGGPLGAIGGLSGGVKFKEAETTLLMADVRSGIQVASAEGKASKMDFSLGGWGWGRLGWANASGYTKTPEGKLIAASLLNNYNRIVLSVRDRPALIQASSDASRKNAAGSLHATDATPATYATPAGGTTQLANASSGLSGMYSGKFVGDDSGTLNVMIGDGGSVTAMGTSNKYRLNFNMSGTVSPSGDLTLTVGDGKIAGAKFVGNINPQSGKLVGMWQRNGNTMGQGTFTGQRQ
jgi:curli biogenesis system outer membrane secretion channel CsgG